MRRIALAPNIVAIVQNHDHPIRRASPAAGFYAGSTRSRRKALRISRVLRFPITSRGVRPIHPGGSHPGGSDLHIQGGQTYLQFFSDSRGVRTPHIQGGQTYLQFFSDGPNFHPGGSDLFAILFGRTECVEPDDFAVEDGNKKLENIQGGQTYLQFFSDGPNASNQTTLQDSKTSRGGQTYLQFFSDGPNASNQTTLPKTSRGVRPICNSFQTSRGVRPICNSFRTDRMRRTRRLCRRRREQKA